MAKKAWRANPHSGSFVHFHDPDIAEAQVLAVLLEFESFGTGAEFSPPFTLRMAALSWTLNPFHQTVALAGSTTLSPSHLGAVNLKWKACHSPFGRHAFTSSTRSIQKAPMPWGQDPK
jgi:hypothetical protein